MGKRQGQGKFVWKDGTVYTGSFYNDKKHGDGEMVLTSQCKIRGTWIDDELCGMSEVTDQAGVRHKIRWHKNTMIANKSLMKASRGGDRQWLNLTLVGLSCASGLSYLWKPKANAHLIGIAAAFWGL